jgi:hypothetical protein
MFINDRRRRSQDRRTRTAEMRNRAKARGQHMGQPPKLTPQQQREARRRRAEGATLKELAKATMWAWRRFHGLA